jgi:hypothetical protein
MRTSALITLLLVSAAFTAPASANWFSRPQAGITLNVGSAPNPTPAQLRALYGPSRYGAYATRGSIDQLSDMEGKTVYGENGEVLGVIATVDLSTGLVDLHLTTGEAVALDASQLINQPNRVLAPALSLAAARALG